MGKVKILKFSNKFLFKNRWGKSMNAKFEIICTRALWICDVLYQVSKVHVSYYGKETGIEREI